MQAAQYCTGRGLDCGWLGYFEVADADFEFVGFETVGQTAAAPRGDVDPASQAWIFRFCFRKARQMDGINRAFSPWRFRVAP
jgi:hypothetical protein